MKLCCLFKVEKDLKQRQRTRDQTGGVGKPGVSLVGLQYHWGGGRLDISWVDLVSVFEMMMRTSKRPKKVGWGEWWERWYVIDIEGQDILKRRDSLTKGVVRIHWAFTLHKHYCRHVRILAETLLWSWTLDMGRETSRLLWDRFLVLRVF